MLIFVLLGCGRSAIAAGDAAHGATVFRACRACHSTAPREQMTGPSLAHVWHRTAGTLAGFGRYSDAMKRANLVWNEKTLDQWLADPQTLRAALKKAPPDGQIVALTHPTIRTR